MIQESVTYKKALMTVAGNLPVNGGIVLVTGATGLIGSCIVDTLLTANSCFDKRFQVYTLGRSKERLERRFGRVKDLYFIEQDIGKPFEIEKTDYIIHAASNADPRSYALYPVETILTNVVGTRNVLELAVKHNSRLLYTSSFEIYGKLDQDHYDEKSYGTIDLDLLRSCYPESKRVSEALVRSYCDEYGANAVIARLSSVYGPTMLPDDSKAHAQFIKNGLAGQDIVLKSKGLQRRTYCYVIDAVSAILKLLFDGEIGEAYNVANSGAVVSIAELAEITAKLTGTKVVYDVPDSVESKGFSKPQDCILDTDKLYSLGWEGRYTAENGMNETLQILKELMSNHKS